MITEVGTADASSKYYGYVPANAFDDTEQMWASGDRDKEQSFPQYIWMHYPIDHVLGKITVTTPNRNGPKSFDVVGSRNCEDWTTLLSVDMAFVDRGFSQSWIVPSAGYFTCFGLKVKSSHTGGNFVDISKIKMFEWLI